MRVGRGEREPRIVVAGETHRILRLNVRSLIIVRKFKTF